jgi:GTP cyclohydrolase FolE2
LWLQNVNEQTSQTKGFKRLLTRNEENKKAPVKVEGNLMFSQRNNPYCDLLSCGKSKIFSTLRKQKIKPL